MNIGSRRPLSSEACSALMAIAQFATSQPDDYFTDDQVKVDTYLTIEAVRAGLAELEIRGNIERHPGSDPASYRLVDNSPENPHFPYP
jgi:hypothetical protein